MTTIDGSMSLASLVDAHPGLASAFERHQLDYCCGGHRSLAVACAERGLDPLVVLGDLATVEAPGDVGDWTTMAAAALCDHLESTHHRYLWDELPRLSALAGKIVTVHGARHPELAVVADVFASIRADLEPHLRKEEQVLFPMIRRLAAADAGEQPAFPCGSLRNPISVMLGEHDAVGDLLARLRYAASDYRVPADGCASYTACFDGLARLEADTHLHIHKENNVLFPLVVRLEAESGTS